MATIQLHNDISDSYTCISNRFIDELLPEANGEFVKVYLYLLRSLSNHSNNCTICGIADHLNHTEKDIVRALKYWEKCQVLGLEYSEDHKGITAIHILDMNASSSPAAPPAKKAPAPRKKAVKTSPEKKEYTLDEIQQFQKDSSVSELFFIIETYLKHPLTSTDTNIILYWYDRLHFHNDLIIYLVEYCISKGHSSLRYMDKVALGWCEEGIRTVEDAKNNASMHSQTYYAVMKAFGISGRNLGDNENAFLTKWSKDLAFDTAMIVEACNRTISAIHQPSFEYADRILSNWHKNRVHTLADIELLDQAHSRAKTASASEKVSSGKNKFSNFNQRDYNYDQLEKMLLGNSVQ